MAEHLQSPFATLTGLTLGLLLPIGPTAGHAVLPALVAMLTAVFVRMDAAAAMDRSPLQGNRLAETARHRPAGHLVLPLLYAAVFAMSAWQARTVVNHATGLPALLPPPAVFYTAPPLTAVGLSRLLRLPADRTAPPTRTTTARNSPTAPAIAAAPVMGPLLQLPVPAPLPQLVRVRPHAEPSAPVGLRPA